MKKINYENLGIIVACTVIVFFLYHIFNYAVHSFSTMNNDNEEYEYIRKMNEDFILNKTIIPPVVNHFNRGLKIDENLFSITYTLNDADFCETFIRQIHQDNEWTTINIKTPSYQKDVPDDELSKAYDLVCASELIINFQLDKKNNYFVERQKNKQEKIKKDKEFKTMYANNTKELEHILLNLMNFYSKGTYLPSPYDYLKNDIIYDKEQNVLTTTYLDTNYNFCERSIHIFKKGLSDEFRNTQIIYFYRETVNLIINDIDLNSLAEYTTSYVCKDNNKIKFTFDSNLNKRYRS